MRFRNKRKNTNPLRIPVHALLVMALMLGLLLPAAASADQPVKIGEYGLGSYSPSALDIIRDTALNPDGTVSVTFRLNKALSATFETQVLLRFRYDSEKMELIGSSVADAFSYDLMFPGTLDYVPYTAHVYCMENKNYPAGNICTLTFTVKDKGTTDLFGESKPYWWVDLGGEDSRPDGPNNPVTVFTPDSIGFYKVSLYEGTRTGIAEEPEKDEEDVTPVLPPPGFQITDLPKTGDSSSLTLCLALCLTSCTGMLTLSLRTKRRRAH